MLFPPAEMSFPGGYSLGVASKVLEFASYVLFPRAGMRMCPPDLALADHHSTRFNPRGAAFWLNASTSLPTSSTARFIASVETVEVGLGALRQAAARCCRRTQGWSGALQRQPGGLLQSIGSRSEVYHPARGGPHFHNSLPIHLAQALLKQGRR